MNKTIPSEKLAISARDDAFTIDKAPSYTDDKAENHDRKLSFTLRACVADQESAENLVKAIQTFVGAVTLDTSPSIVEAAEEAAKAAEEAAEVEAQQAASRAEQERESIRSMILDELGSFRKIVREDIADALEAADQKRIDS